MDTLCCAIFSKYQILERDNQITSNGFKDQNILDEQAPTGVGDSGNEEEREHLCHEDRDNTDVERGIVEETSFNS